MQALTVESLLSVWEGGRSRHPIDRAVLLHAAATPHADVDAMADEPLGRRNRALLRLHMATFGGQLPAYLDCPNCGQRLELMFDAATLLAPQPQIEAPVVEIDGLRFRMPTSRDLACIAHESDAETATLRLMQGCMLGAPGTDTPGGPMVSPAEHSAPASRQNLLPLLDLVEQALEAADPCADISFAVTCEACGHAWEAPFDVAAFIWDEIESRARRLLDEVHLLARTYGWSESEILALPEARRAAYLQRVMA